MGKFCGEQGSSSGLMIAVVAGVSDNGVAAGDPPHAETRTNGIRNKHRKKLFICGIITNRGTEDFRPSVEVESFWKSYFFTRTKVPVFSVVRTL